MTSLWRLGFGNGFLTCQRNKFHLCFTKSFQSWNSISGSYFTSKGLFKHVSPYAFHFSQLNKLSIIYSNHHIIYQEVESTINMYAFFQPNFILNLQRSRIKLPWSLSWAALQFNHYCWTLSKYPSLLNLCFLTYKRGVIAITCPRECWIINNKKHW